MPILRHTIPGFPPSVSPSSHACETDGFIFLTGQFGRNPENPTAPLPEGIAAQTAQTLTNLRSTLNALGLDLHHILSVRVFLTEFKRDYAEMNRTYATFFPPEDRPTRACVGVTALVHDALIEIDCIARRP